jgi:hypothetical protein
MRHALCAVRHQPYPLLIDVKKPYKAIFQVVFPSPKGVIRSRYDLYKLFDPI